MRISRTPGFGFCLGLSFRYPTVGQLGATGAAGSPIGTLERSVRYSLGSIAPHLDATGTLFRQRVSRLRWPAAGFGAGRHGQSRLIATQINDPDQAIGGKPFDDSTPVMERRTPEGKNVAKIGRRPMHQSRIWWRCWRRPAVPPNQFGPLEGGQYARRRPIVCYRYCMSCTWPLAQVTSNHVFMPPAACSSMWQ